MATRCVSEGNHGVQEADDAQSASPRLYCFVCFARVQPSLTVAIGMCAVWHVPASLCGGPRGEPWGPGISHRPRSAPHTVFHTHARSMPCVEPLSPHLINFRIYTGSVPLQIVGHASPDVVEVTHDYTAQRHDELTLRVGDIIQGARGCGLSSC